jgi:hypothetical protein
LSLIQIVVDLQAAPRNQRAAALERLLAGAQPIAGLSHWRGNLLKALAPDQPCQAAPFAARGAGVLPAAGCVFAATAIEYRASLTELHLGSDGLVPLDGATATEIADSFNNKFKDLNVILRVSSNNEMYAVFAAQLRVDTHPPELARRFDLYALQAQGQDASTLRRLMSEIELWLHDHPSNRRRAAGGLPTICGLWLWGGGAAEPLTRHTLWALGSNSFLDGLGAVPVAGDVLAGSGVLRWPLPAANDCSFAHFDSVWIRRAIEALRAGRTARIEVWLGEFGYSIETLVRRWWPTKRRPWPEYLDAAS